MIFKEKLDSEVAALRAKLEAELKQRTILENEMLRLKKLVPENSKYVEVNRSYYSYMTVPEILSVLLSLKFLN